MNFSKTTNTKTIIIAITLSFLLLTSISCGFLGGSDSYTADMVQLSNDGQVINKSKLFVTPDAYRIDRLMTNAKEKSSSKLKLSIIGLKKENKQYFFNHDKKLYFKSNLDEKGIMQSLKSYKDVESKKEIGKEKINGYKCIKSKITNTYTFMEFTTKDTITLWENDKFEYPLRTEDQDGDITEMRNIDNKSISKKKFKINSSYKEVTNIMAVMGMDFSSLKNNKEGTKQIKKDENNQDVTPNDLMQGFKKMMGNKENKKQINDMQKMMTQAFSQVQHAAQQASDESNN